MAPEPATSVVLVGAGDIGWCGLAGADLTARLLDRIDGEVFTAGDNAYMSGLPTEFANCYEPYWGRHLARTHPSPGNHDYETAGASGYFSYFGSRAGPAGLGYYSFDLGAWHIVSLNSNVAVEAGSAEERWLADDLQAHRNRCVLAYWHHPLFSSSQHGNDPRMIDFWRTLYAAGADVVISGHDHVYERFAPQTPFGAIDPARGIREFVVGTGGALPYVFVAVQPNSESRYAGWGVLKVTLQETSYRWEFVPVEAGAFTDTGQAACTP